MPAASAGARWCRGFVRLPEDEAREWLAQLDAVTPQTLPLALAGGQAEAKKRGPGRPRKDGPSAGAPIGADSDGVDLGALAAGQ